MNEFGADVGADKLKEGIRHTSDGAKNSGKQISSAVVQSSAYVRTNGARNIIEDVEGLITEHPGKVLLTVAAVAFLD